MKSTTSNRLEPKTKLMKKVSIKKSDIDRMIEEATVDAHDETEQAMGFLAAIQDEIACPFTAFIVGELVDVVGFDAEGNDPAVIAICKRNGKMYKVGATSLEWHERPPKGYEWIEAYKVWLRGATTT